MRASGAPIVIKADGLAAGKGVVLAATEADALAAVDMTFGGGLRWFPDPALTVVMATKGYPGNYGKGSVIKGLDAAAAVEGVEIFHAGTVASGDDVLANGGRVLNVTASGKTVAEAQRRAYQAIDRIDWPEGFCRRDIGWQDRK